MLEAQNIDRTEAISHDTLRLQSALPEGWCSVEKGTYQHHVCCSPAGRRVISVTDFRLAPPRTRLSVTDLKPKPSSVHRDIFRQTLAKWVPVLLVGMIVGEVALGLVSDATKFDISAANESLHDATLIVGGIVGIVIGFYLGEFARR